MIRATLITIVAWFAGLVIDANEPQGFLCLRVLFPVLAMGLCVLKNLKDSKDK